jgi:hypothetical protein
MKTRSLIVFVFSVLQGLIFGAGLWIFRELIIRYNYVGSKSAVPFIFHYDVYLFVIIVFGLPTGAILGLWLACKYIFQSAISGKRYGLIYACVVLGMLMLMLFRVYVIEAVSDGNMLCVLRGHSFIYLLLIMLGVFVTVSHRLFSNTKGVDE